jgi:hypothetical protein
MSGDGFEISLESLRTNSESLVRGVDGMSTAFTDLENRLNGYGAPWGTGLLGMAFEVIYTDVKEMAFGAYEANAEVISEFAEGLDSMAADMEDMETELTSGFEELVRILDTSKPAGP